MDRLKDDASDLFGRPPGKVTACHGCGQNAEVFVDSCCWLCVMSGQRDRIKFRQPNDPRPDKPQPWEKTKYRAAI